MTSICAENDQIRPESCNFDRDQNGIVPNAISDRHAFVVPCDMRRAEVRRCTPVQ
jgi:hypothetical protein